MDNRRLTPKQSSEMFAELLLRTGAVKLSPKKPFTWTSGILSPIYCDNPIVMSEPSPRNFTKNELTNLVRDHFYVHTDVVAGIATAGIAWGFSTADMLNLIYCYVRPEPKKHGMKNQIEGKLPKGSRVLLVENLISTGKSSMQAVNAIREAECEVIGLVALFEYGFPETKELFKKEKVLHKTISNFDVLCNVAAKSKFIKEKDLDLVKSFAADPQNWKP